MKFGFYWQDKHYYFDSTQGQSIAIELQFDGKQPNFYGVPDARVNSLNDGRFIGDTRLGGSCNVNQIQLIPHCNGTHTECVGHISNERISISETLQSLLCPAALISVTPTESNSCTESYSIPFQSNDRIICKDSIAMSLNNLDTKGIEALIIRSLPNPDSKTSHRYQGDSPHPFFSSEAMEFINELSIAHLLVDMPSIDRANDEGKLNNHRIYWDYTKTNENRSRKTITEMIFVNNAIDDGIYVLNLQTAAFKLDASPSNPIIYQLQPATD